MDSQDYISLIDSSTMDFDFSATGHGLKRSADSMGHEDDATSKRVRLSQLTADPPKMPMPRRKIAVRLPQSCFTSSRFYVSSVPIVVAKSVLNQKNEEIEELKKKLAESEKKLEESEKLRREGLAREAQHQKRADDLSDSYDILEQQFWYNEHKHEIAGEELKERTDENKELERKLEATEQFQTLLSEAYHILNKRCKVIFGKEKAESNLLIAEQQFENLKNFVHQHGLHVILDSNKTPVGISDSPQELKFITHVFAAAQKLADDAVLAELKVVMSRNDEHVGDLLVDSIEEIPEEYKINSRDLRELLVHCKVFKELERLRRIAEKEEKERQEAEKQARIEAARRRQRSFSA